VLVERVVGLVALGGMSGPGDRSFSNAFVLVCLDPGDEGRAEYLRQLPGFVHWVKSARRLPGTTEVVLPGELEQRRRSAAEVLHLDAPTSGACAELARRAGIPAPGA
jgi:LDH2 family malate/lactate/ureidoglycolate dehydrogenase